MAISVQQTDNGWALSLKGSHVAHIHTPASCLRTGQHHLQHLPLWHWVPEQTGEALTPEKGPNMC